MDNRSFASAVESPVGPASVYDEAARIQRANGGVVPTIVPMRQFVDGACDCGKPEACPGPGKHPAIRWNELDVGIGRQVIRQDVAHGILTGSRSKCFVVECDDEEAERWLVERGVPETFAVRSGSGRGLHRYFRLPKDAKAGTSRGALHPKIDVRGEGGLAIIAGSPHKSGNMYAVEVDAPIAEPPSWLVNWFKEREGPTRDTRDAAEIRTTVPLTDRIQYARQWANDQEPAISGNGGHDQTIKVLAHAARDFCVTTKTGLVAATGEWLARAEPPWSDKDIEHKINEALHRSELPWDVGGVGLRHWLSKREKRAANDAEAFEHVQPKRLSAAERALTVGGISTRLKTGYPTIDACTRGGVLLRKTLIVGGAPGAGKTATAVQLAYRWLVEGVHVAILAADEEADALLIRIGQLIGLSRDDLERGDSNAREQLAAWCKAHPLTLFDGDDDDADLETVSRELRCTAGGALSALIVDSLQTVRIKSNVKSDDPRGRMNEVVRIIKKSAKVDGHVVVATSEISRAAYRRKEQADNANPLSAFKESGDIEYAASLALVLTSRAGSSEFVDAAVVKNRLGPGRPQFMLRLEHARARVSETDASQVSELDPLADRKALVLRLMQESTDDGVQHLSKNALNERMGGNRRTNFKAIDALVEDNLLTQAEKGIRLPRPGDIGFQL